MFVAAPEGGCERLREEHSSRTDQELVAAANAGDSAAFEALYWRYRDWAHRLALRFTRNEDLALDILQETFIYFLKKFPGFELRSELKTFLYPVVRNLSITLQQKANRYSALPEGMEESPAPVEAASVSKEGLALVLAALPEFHREVLLLRFVDGLALNEIATALNIPLGTVKSRLHNALEALRQDPRTRSFFNQ
jgi:RNA polymerase sigma-70 factor (ECF subfamily)